MVLANHQKLQQATGELKQVEAKLGSARVEYGRSVEAWAETRAKLAAAQQELAALTQARRPGPGPRLPDRQHASAGCAEGRRPQTLIGAHRAARARADRFSQATATSSGTRQLMSGSSGQIGRVMPVHGTRVSTGVASPGPSTSRICSSEKMSSKPARKWPRDFRDEPAQRRHPDAEMLEHLGVEALVPDGDEDGIEPALEPQPGRRAEAEAPPADGAAPPTISPSLTCITCASAVSRAEPGRSRRG